MEASTTLTVSEGDNEFSWPDDFKAELNPEISDDGGSGYRRLGKIIKDGIDRRSGSDTGRPLNYRIWEETGKFILTSDSAFSFPLEYYKYFADLDTDDDLTNSDFQAFLNKVHEAVECYALARCYEKLQKFDVARYYQNDNPRLPTGLGRFELCYLVAKEEDEEIGLANVDLQMSYPG